MLDKVQNDNNAQKRSDQGSGEATIFKSRFPEGLMKFFCVHCNLIPLYRKFTISSNKSPPCFRSPLRTRSHIRMENQEVQQAMVSATKFNEMKNERRNLIHIVSITDQRIYLLPQLHKIQGALKVSHQAKSLMTRPKAYIPSVEINIP